MEVNSDEATMTNRRELMVDEQLMSRVLNSMKLHAKAKVVIFRRLDEIEQERLKFGTRRDQARDMLETEVDFKDIQERLNQLIIQGVETTRHGT